MVGAILLDQAAFEACKYVVTFYFTSALGLNLPFNLLSKTKLFVMSTLHQSVKAAAFPTNLLVFNMKDYPFSFGFNIAAFKGTVQSVPVDLL